MSPRNRLCILVVCLGALLCAKGVYIGAQTGTVIDKETGRVLWSKDADAQMYPASTTKIMTALLFLEATKPDDIVTAPPDVDHVTGSSLYLKPFEKVRAEDLAYAILLRSANDGCYAAAIHVAGSENAFVDLMNKRAKEIGCTGTHFTNPHGLHDPMHYTTASDLAMIAREAMKNEEFAKIARTESKSIWRSLNTEDTLITTHNKFLKQRPEATGIKTGWTVPAGRCFVGSSEHDGMSIITVVLKSTDWLSDTEALTDWTFSNFEKKPVVKKGTVVASEKVGGGTKPQVRAALAEDLLAVVEKGASPKWKVVSTSFNYKLPLIAGEKIGSVTLADGDGNKETLPVVSAESVGRSAISFVGPTAFALVIGCLIAARFYFRRPYRRW